MNVTWKARTTLALLLAATPIAAMAQGAATDPATPAVPAPAEAAPADNGPAVTMGTPVKNADGSINVSQLIGLDVQSTTGGKVGDVGEVVLDDAGKVQGVVVDVGGFLGVNTHPVLLSWQDVTLAGSGDKVTANVAETADSLKTMPVYERARE